MTDYADLLDVVDLFAGPGGWDVALQRLVLMTLGIEYDKSTCETRRAAGLLTLEDDVRAHGPKTIKARRLAGSPPCTTFSAAGRKNGREHLAELQTYAALMGHRMPLPTGSIDETSQLALEPLRWALEAIDLGEPYESIALEQVPAVLPLWESVAEVLVDEGYSVDTGVLRAEKYGVPQTRKRAFLVAHRDRSVSLPKPTHGPDLKPIVTGAQALGWDYETTLARTREEGWYTPDMAGGLDYRDWFFHRAAVTVTGRVQCPPAYRKDKQSQTTARGQVRLTVEEAALIQTFPPRFPWPKSLSACDSQIGNAVPPMLAEAVFRELF